jgi:holo-[acyl-carrier protein] synthase
MGIDMLAAGVDIVEIGRVEQVLRRFGQRFLRRVYTEAEVAVCRGRPWELAARFAAKEAVMKALGTGARGIAWREIEVLPNRRGKPLVYLYSRARERAEILGLTELEISMTHSREYAVAMAVAIAAQMVEERGDTWREKLLTRLRERGSL